MLLFVELLQAQRWLWCTSFSPKGRQLLHGCPWRKILLQTWGNKINVLRKPLGCGKSSKHAKCLLPQVYWHDLRKPQKCSTPPECQFQQGHHRTATVWSHFLQFTEPAKKEINLLKCVFIFLRQDKKIKHYIYVSRTFPEKFLMCLYCLKYF